MVAAVFRPLPDHLALAGITGLGLSWGLGVAWAQWSEVQASGLQLYQAIPLVVAGGMATVLPLWFGIGAVMWAMCRVCGHRAGFGAVLATLSASGLALWIAAPAAAFLFTDELLHSSGPLWVLLAAGVGAFCAQVIVSLHRKTDVSLAKATGSVALTGIFCTSFLSLYQ